MSESDKQSLIESLKNQILVLQLQLQIARLQQQIAAVVQTK